MTSYSLKVYKKSNHMDLTEGDRNIVLKNKANCVSGVYFDLDNFDYVENKGKLSASFVNVNGNFNIWIGLAHKNSVTTSGDVKDRNNVYSFSAYDGDKWSSKGGERYGVEWDKKNAKIGLEIDFASKVLSFNVDNEPQGNAF